MRVTMRDTIEYMNSTDWKDRLIAEYWQTKIRYQKLNILITKYHAGESDSHILSPINVLTQQRTHMKEYLGCLKYRAKLADIDLRKICAEQAQEETPAPEAIESEQSE